MSVRVVVDGGGLWTVRDWETAKRVRSLRCWSKCSSNVEYMTLNYSSKTETQRQNEKHNITSEKFHIHPTHTQQDIHVAETPYDQTDPASSHSSTK